MPCVHRLQSSARRLRLKVPEDATDRDVQEILGAIDHDEVHRILNTMSDEDVAHLIERLWAKKRRRPQVQEAIA